MYQLIRAVFVFIGFTLATCFLGGAGVTFTHGYNAPRELSIIIVTVVFLGCFILAANFLVKYLFAEKFKKIK
ncbi:MAG: hypothetical protein ACTH8P_03605 [Ewingella sp.]|uniref:hypothetical protein n=1 Tax=Ewingella TaxID=41201 RepID=UPI0033657A1C